MAVQYNHKSSIELDSIVEAKDLAGFIEDLNAYFYSDFLISTATGLIFGTGFVPALIAL